MEILKYRLTIFLSVAFFLVILEFFYLWYFLEYLYRRIKYKTHSEAYYHISFEKEAYANETNFEYLKNRKFYSFLKYL